MFITLKNTTLEKEMLSPYQSPLHNGGFQIPSFKHVGVTVEKTLKPDAFG